MFSFKRKERKMSAQEVSEFLHSKIREQLEYEDGNRDYSFISMMNPENVESNISTEYQTTIITMTIYNGIKDALCNNDIMRLKPYISDLETVPLYKQKVNQNLLVSLQRIQKIRDMRVIDTKQLESCFEKLRENAWELREVGCGIAEIWGNLLAAQSYKEMPERTLDEAIHDLKSAVFSQFTNDELIQAKQALVACALIYGDLYLEESFSLADDRTTNNAFDLYYECPYRLLFEDGNNVSTEMIISKIIIYAENGVDLDLASKLTQYMKQIKGTDEEKEKADCVFNTLSFYGIQELNELLSM